jgi:5-oxopent-3-ene-1,2,5-tricarboxylate decarboxylase/2-hydroxyhepta-2,4-diene-1,7-dioate isomerase
MRLAQLEDKSGFVIGLWHKDRWLNFSLGMKIYGEVAEMRDRTQVETIQQLLSEGKFELPSLKEIESFIQVHNLSNLLALGKDAILKAPILHPPKIIALGRNYVLHAKEARLPVPKEPIIFEKASSSVTGPYDTVQIPREYGRIDHEAELAVVIGRRASKVSKREAFSYVAGYTIVQDITARDLQNADLAENNPWFRSKSFDTFTPMGPWLVLTDEIKPPINLKIECRVNGKVRQKANTRDLVFNIPTMIEFITRHITLEPGDVISTGTPEGIGAIKGGDTITTRVAGIGEMKNRVKYTTR